ncbi:putative COP9 signalosome complex subunit 12 [Rosellinia necatrix]|uniref:Protein CSN12 homolog n=1 Tax=Rosellinia necatrix TaxID=77044 RepID=A0A1W2TKJ4_ROSNE|nr:putative COP9 signalosome complex subunit 12 [Rosellinia necatrix]
MDGLIRQFRVAYSATNGEQLAETLNPDVQAHSAKLQAIWGRGDIRSMSADLHFLFHQDQARFSARLSKEEANGWCAIYNAYGKAVGEMLAVEGLRGDAQSSWAKVYNAWKEVTLLTVRGYTNHDFENWTIPCLYITGRYLRLFAMRADAERGLNNEDVAMDDLKDDFDPQAEENKSLEDCARHLNRIFQVCASDRAPLEESRKWGVYYAVNLLFKTYFKLNSEPLSKNILKVISAGRDIPPIDKFPKSQQVTFKYYEGVLAFLEENYVAAEKHLEAAWLMCHRSSQRNLELLLTYLIPCRLLTTHTLPSARLLEPFPRLQKLFIPLARAIKKADLRAFDIALRDGEDEFIKRRVYLTLERGRDIVLRNLLRKVFIAGGFEEGKDGAAPVRRTRIPITEFTAAVQMSSGEAVDSDEVECLMANMIYKNLMKGYIAHERGTVVLSKSGAFPGTKV